MVLSSALIDYIFVIPNSQLRLKTTCCLLLLDLVPNSLGLPSLHPEPQSLTPEDGGQSPTHLHYRSKHQLRRFSMEVRHDSQRLGNQKCGLAGLYVTTNHCFKSTCLGNVLIRMWREPVLFAFYFELRLHCMGLIQNFQILPTCNFCWRCENAFSLA